MGHAIRGPKKKFIGVQLAQGDQRAKRKSARMSSRKRLKTTFEISHTVEPFYTGGAADLDRAASILASSVGEDVLLTDFKNGQRFGKIEGVCTLFV